MAEERIGNIRTVKAFSQEQAEMKRYTTKVQNVLELAKREAWARGIFYGMVHFSNLLNNKSALKFMVLTYSKNVFDLDRF